MIYGVEDKYRKEDQYFNNAIKSKNHENAFHPYHPCVVGHDVLG